MWRWALKSLLFSPLGLAVSILSVASAFLLVMFFEAVYAGETRQIVAYVETADADIWLMQEGVSNMHMATSYIPAEKLDLVREINGVRKAEGILYLNTVISAADQRWFAYLVGLDPASELAKPQRVRVGVDTPQRGEVVVPDVLARLASLDLGDQIRIIDRNLAIVGLSENTFSMANSVVFLSKSDLEDMMSVLDLFSFILIQHQPGVSVQELISRISRNIEDVEALPATQFVNNDRALAVQMGVETISLMTGIGGGLAALLVAFTIYSEISRQQKELAAAKALGAGSSQIYSSVLLQALIITGSAVVLATMLSLLVMPLITFWVPLIQLELTKATIARVGFLGLIVAAVSAWLPARQVNKLDPVAAFS